MGDSIKTTGTVKPLSPMTIAIGARSIAIQRDKVPKPKNIPPNNNSKIPCLEYEIFFSSSVCFLNRTSKIKPYAKVQNTIPMVTPIRGDGIVSSP